MTTVMQQIEKYKPGELITSIQPVEFLELVRVLLRDDTTIGSLHDLDIDNISKARRVKAKKLVCLANVVNTSPETFQLLLRCNWTELLFRAAANNTVNVEVKLNKTGMV